MRKRDCYLLIDYNPEFRQDIRILVFIFSRKNRYELFMS